MNPLRLPEAMLVEPSHFGSAVAEAVGSGRLLHLAQVPALPGREDPAGFVLALWERDGVTGCIAAPGHTPTRPSQAGLRSAPLEEQHLETEGLQWAEPPASQAVLGQGVFTFPLGPVRGAVAESAAWRFATMGDELLQLEMRFGYKRRHMEAQLSWAHPEEAPRIAERITGTSPVAHAWAASLCWEAALGIPVSPEASMARAIMAECERIYSHLGDLASLADSTGLPAGAAELWAMKEEILRLCYRTTGHRYQRGRIIPGGLNAPLEPVAEGPSLLRAVQDRVHQVIGQLDRSPSFLDRLHRTGRLPLDTTLWLAPVGPVGRSIGRPYDVRWDLPYAPYGTTLAPARAGETSGDAWARYRVRVQEIHAATEWLMQHWSSAFEAAGAPPLPPGRTEDGIWLGRTEAPGGELLYLLHPGHWMRVRPPACVHWLALPYALAEGHVLQDVPIVDASFALSVAAMDR